MPAISKWKKADFPSCQSNFLPLETKDLTRLKLLQHPACASLQHTMPSRLLLPLLVLTGLTLAEDKPKAPKGPVLPSMQPASVQMVPGAPDVVPGGFTIATMPDTQFYVQLHPGIFPQADPVDRRQRRQILDPLHDPSRRRH